MAEPTTLPFDWADPFALDAQLSDEERMVRDTAESYAREKLQPRVTSAYLEERFDREILNEMGSLGLLGATIAPEYGGAGLNYVSYGLIARAVERVDSGYRSAMSVQSSLVMHPINAYGTEEQKRKYLPKLATGEWIGCFGLTEPDAGSDPGSMRTRARRDGNDWILSGTKMWITNGSVADVAVVWAQTDEGVRGFLVPAGMPGFTTQDIHQKLSLRASVTSELLLDDVRLPADAQLPEAAGLRAPLSCLSEARFGIVFGAVGAARACYEAALDYSITREQFGKPIGGFQLTQAKLAQMLLKVNQGMLLALHLGRMKDGGTLRPEHVSFGKLANVNAALEVAREARQVLGANGITLEYPVIRHMNNLESVVTYEGTADVHTLVLGQAMTGLPAYR
jgi:glutaryl-CoA dehydrogenase